LHPPHALALRRDRGRKNWGFSASDPPALSFRREFERNYNGELILRIFDGSSKTGRIRKIPEEFQKNRLFPLAILSPGRTRTARLEAPTNSAIGRNIRPALRTQGSQPAPRE